MRHGRRRCKGNWVLKALTKWLRIGLCGWVLFGLFGCASLRPSSQSQAIEDGAPDSDIDVTHLADAIPEKVIITNAGNRSPYTVLGKTYHIDFDTEGFTESGYASWYGKKFHGNKTSNGETYDMFAMTAAHKTLAIPTYVRVTNLENQRTVVVRVNDRGPFHSGRIIDLSYAAAKKLGYHQKGTAKVKIEVLTRVEDPKVASAVAGVIDPALMPENTDNAPKTYLQAGAFSKQESAVQLQRRLHALTGHSVEVRAEPLNKLYKVLIGPIVDRYQLVDLRQKLLDANMSAPHKVEL